MRSTLASRICRRGSATKASELLSISWAAYSVAQGTGDRPPSGGFRGVFRTSRGHADWPRATRRYPARDAGQYAFARGQRLQRHAFGDRAGSSTSISQTARSGRWTAASVRLSGPNSALVRPRAQRAPHGPGRGADPHLVRASTGDRVAVPPRTDPQNRNPAAGRQHPGDAAGKVPGRSFDAEHSRGDRRRGRLGQVRNKVPVMFQMR